MRGSVIKRGSTYSIVLDLGRGPDGKRQRKWHSGYRTRKDAERARVELLAQVDNGIHVEPSRLTVAMFLRDQWLLGLTGQVRPTALHSYRSNLERYVLPRIGQVPLQRLTPARLDTLYGLWRAAGRRRPGRSAAGSSPARPTTPALSYGNARRWSRR